MRIFLNYLTLILLLGTTGVMVSCDKEDEVASITLKKVGNLKVSLFNNGQALASTEARISNSDTGREIKVVNTNEQGLIELTDMIEGTYSVTVELEEPVYQVATQQFQVISGETKEVSMEATEHVGSVRLFLRDKESTEIIREDLKIGIALVPYSLAYQKALKNEERIALAADIRYFKSAGEIMFDNIPTGRYYIYQVAADTIVNLVESYYSVSRATERTKDLLVDYFRESLVAQSPFFVASMTSSPNYYGTEEETESPFFSFRFYPYYESLKAEIVMEDGVVFEVYANKNAGGFYELSSATSKDEKFELSFYWTSGIEGIYYQNDRLHMNSYAILLENLETNERVWYYNVSIDMQ